MDKNKRELIIRELARQQAFGIKKAVNLGGSCAIVIPKTWLKWHGVLIDGEYYFKMDVDGETLVLIPITDEDVKGVKLEMKGVTS